MTNIHHADRKGRTTRAEAHLPHRPTAPQAPEPGDVWNFVYAREETSGEVQVQVEFPTRHGNVRSITVSASTKDLVGSIAAKLRGQSALFEGGDGERTGFIRDRLAKANETEIILTQKPGFRGLGGFVLPDQMLGECHGRYRWNLAATDPVEASGTMSGTLAEWQDSIGRVALHSSYLSVGIMIALAAPLASYVKLRTKQAGSGQQLLSESALFNFSGASGAGKTTAAMVAASVVGSPIDLAKWEITRRGIEEYLSSRNDLPAIFDDTEKCVGDGPQDLKKALRNVGQLLPDGSSKILSAIVAPKGLARLSWSTIGLSTSPKPIRTIAASLGWQMSEGEMVRIIDMALPPRHRAGVFDELKTTGQTRVAEGRRRIDDLGEALKHQFGTLLPAWIEFLMSQDHSARLIRYRDRFVKGVCPSDDGWEIRFARKFGVLAAAGRLAAERGLLPWPKRWALRAAHRAYKRARSAIKSPDEGAIELLRAVAAGAVDSTMIVRPTESHSGAVRFPLGAMGMHYRHKGVPVLALRDEVLDKLARDRPTRSAFDALLASRGLIRGGHGDRRTTQIRREVAIDGRVITKPRFLLIDLKAIKSTAMML